MAGTIDISALISMLELFKHFKKLSILRVRRSILVLYCSPGFTCVLNNMLTETMKRAGGTRVFAVGVGMTKWVCKCLCTINTMYPIVAL